MTTFMRSAAVAAVSLFVAFVTVGCDDVGGGGGGGTTTTSTSVTTVTTSTLPTTTTTGIITTTTGIVTTTTTGGVRECPITFRLNNTVNVASLQWETDYTGGAFAGTADLVQCTDLVPTPPAHTLLFNDLDATSQLNTAMIVFPPSEVAGAADLARCTFQPSGADPTAGNFTITVTDATDKDLNPVTAEVVATVGTCIGGGGGTTTTLGGTTTTLGGTTTTVGGGNQFDVTFSLTDAVLVGALQLEIPYGSAPGVFNGSADTVNCTDLIPLPPVHTFLFNDLEATSILNAALIVFPPNGAQGPLDLFRCVFDQTGATAPVPGDFVVNVVDASDPDLNPITPTPTINVAVTPK